MLATRKVEAMLVHFNDDVARPFPSSTNKLLLAYLDTEKNAVVNAALMRRCMEEANAVAATDIVRMY